MCKWKADTHLPRGLRSEDRGMPEEINRVLTDQLSDLLFTTERSALDNLVKAKQNWLMNTFMGMIK